jgi:hypothetical protein
MTMTTNEQTRKWEEKKFCNDLAEQIKKICFMNAGWPSWAHPYSHHALKSQRPTPKHQ